MDKHAWLSRLKDACEAAGTYKPAFDSTLTTLAEIMERRDEVMQQYEAEGKQILIETVTDRGSRNRKENPLLATWKDLNKDALAYLRELGLTPKSLKVEPKQEKEPSTLEKWIYQLEHDLGMDGSGSAEDDSEDDEPEDPEEQEDQDASPEHGISVADDTGTDPEPAEAEPEQDPGDFPPHNRQKAPEDDKPDTGSGAAKGWWD